MTLMVGALDREPTVGFCGNNYVTHLCVCVCVFFFNRRGISGDLKYLTSSAFLQDCCKGLQWRRLLQQLG